MPDVPVCPHGALRRPCSLCEAGLPAGRECCLWHQAIQMAPDDVLGRVVQEAQDAREDAENRLLQAEAEVVELRRQNEIQRRNLTAANRECERLGKQLEDLRNAQRRAG